MSGKPFPEGVAEVLRALGAWHLDDRSAIQKQARQAPMKPAKEWAEWLRRNLGGRCGLDLINDDDVWAKMAADIEKMFSDCQVDAVGAVELAIQDLDVDALTT